MQRDEPEQLVGAQPNAQHTAASARTEPFNLPLKSTPSSELKKRRFLSTVHHPCFSLLSEGSSADLREAAAGAPGARVQMAPSAAEMARQVKLLTAPQTAGPTLTNFADTRGFAASGGFAAEKTPLGLCYRRCGGTALLEQTGMELSSA